MRCLVAMAALLLPQAFPQATVDTGTPVLIRTESRLRQVSVVVHDKNGRAMTGLKRNQFTVTDNGRVREVKVFVSEVPAPPSASHRLPEGIFTNIPEGADSPEAHFTVILVDRVNTEWSDQTQARQRVRKYLQESPPNTRVAVAVLGPDLRIVHDFDTDHQRLLNAFDLPVWKSSYAYPDRDTVRRILKQERLALLERQVRESLAAFTAIGNYLAGVSGRKSIVWLTAGFRMIVDSRVIPGAALAERDFRDDVARTLRKLNTAGVAVYPVDARGLSVQRARSSISIR